MAWVFSEGEAVWPAIVVAWCRRGDGDHSGCGGQREARHHLQQLAIDATHGVLHGLAVLGCEGRDGGRQGGGA